MERTKYNVSKDVSQRLCDGIVFDSVMEMKYYRDVLLPQVERGEILNYELQKPYELQPKFTRENGERVRAIVYLADFYIKYKDGSEVVIDIKGCPDAMAKLKRKMIWRRYPKMDYRWIVYVKKFGGWIDFEMCDRLRKEERKQKKQEQKEQEEQENREEDNGDFEN